MALRKLTNKGVYQLTDREIKKELMSRWGLNPKSSEDQAEYKRRYNSFRNRAANYAKQQQLDEPLHVNEILLRTVRNQQSEAPLTALQAGILSTSSQHTANYVQRIQRGDQRIINQGILNLERQYNGLLTKNTLGLEKQYEEFRTRAVTTQNLSTPDGEIVAVFDRSNGQAEPVFITSIVNDEEIVEVYFEGQTIATYNLSAGDKLPILEPPVTVREVRTDQSIQEVKEYFQSLADALHAWQDSRLASNRGIYGRGSRARKRVGS